eukprot:m.306478 g.306478  ORF g.306478 m.306478 type:complete len:372 (+) comp19622_c0_seq17:168-1283(+)
MCANECSVKVFQRFRSSIILHCVQFLTAICSCPSVQLLLGLADDSVERLNPATGDIVSLATGVPTAAGLEPVPSVDRVVCCGTDGIVRCYSRSFDTDPTELKTTATVNRVRLGISNPHLVAVAAKQAGVRIWDLNESKSVFKSKNLPNDMLNLPIPICDNDVQFIPGSGDNRFVTGTAHHEVRIYDRSAKPRPVMNITLDDLPITCLAVTPDGRTVITGDTVGTMKALDLRTGAVLGKYKGIKGACRDIVCHPTLPFVAQGGLDRFARVYDIRTRKLVHQFYLKQRINRVLFSPEGQQATALVTGDGKAADGDGTAAGEGNGGEEENVDELWEEMALAQDNDDANAAPGAKRVVAANVSRKDRKKPRRGKR